MQTISLPSLRPSLRFRSDLLNRISRFDCKTRVYHGPILAIKKDADSHKEQDRIKGKLVDENMIVLRVRIQEMKMEEAKNCAKKSDSWSEWEKEWYKNYDSDVYEVVGLLQNFLMDARPSLVLGMVALFIFSTSTSIALLLNYLLQIVMGTHF